MEDHVLMIKAIVNYSASLVQDSLLLCNLKGNSALIDLAEVAMMPVEELKKNAFLLDVKALLLDEHSLRVVEGVEELVKLGERLQAPVKDDKFVDLRSWHQDLPLGYWPTLKYVYPGKVDGLTAPFKVVEGQWEWSGKFKNGHELGSEQQRLLYGTASLLVELTVDGIVERTFATDIEERPPEHL